MILSVHEIEQLHHIIRDAGAAIMDMYASDDFGVIQKDDDGYISPLTKADLAAHEIIQAGLEAMTPDIPILSEESKEISYEERKERTTFRCVDPLDGTKEFVKRNGEFTVNIALIHEGYPVAGCIYVPVSDDLYRAVKGE
jgi:3'(2'), 5'-bisphosphate nucleotidase